MEFTTDQYQNYLERALEYAKVNFSASPIQHQKSFANSVAHALTGISGGYGGPSMREHLSARVSSTVDRSTLTFEAACTLLEECCFGPITEKHAKLLVVEHCFGDTEEDKKVAKEIALKHNYYQMFA